MGGIAGDVISVGSGGLIDGDGLIGGLTGENQAGAAMKGAQAQLQGIRESNQLQRDLFNGQAGLTEWQRGIGNQALNQLAGLYGIQGGFNPAGTVRFGPDGKIVETPAGTPPAGSGASGQPNFAAFFNSPDYAYALSEGQKGIDRAAAAGGNLFGGNRLQAANQHAQGLASQNFGNYFNRLSSLAGIGTASTNQLGQSLQNTGNNISQGLMGMGDARASGYIGAGNARQAGYNNLFSLGGSLGSAALLACDRRLKKNIEHVGEYKGHKWYVFDYLWGDKGAGPMADEVMQTRPDAVVEGPNGLLFVDLGKL
jgi:hypothetical protein